MPREGYVAELRQSVGNRPLLLPSVAALVHRHEDDRILVGMHRDMRCWVIPGGAIEPDETPADCVVREVWEETRLTVEVTGVRGAFGGTPEHRIVYPNGDVCDYVAIVFDVIAVAGEAQPTEELVEIRWVTIEELADLPKLAWMRPMMDNPGGWEPPSWRPPSP